MKVTHETTIRATCPVNGAFDTYVATFEANRLIKVEDILEAIKGLPTKLYQEQITQYLAAKLDCRVVTIGYHSGVKTTCSA